MRAACRARISAVPGAPRTASAALRAVKSRSESVTPGAASSSAQMRRIRATPSGVRTRPCQARNQAAFRVGSALPVTPAQRTASTRGAAARRTSSLISDQQVVERWPSSRWTFCSTDSDSRPRSSSSNQSPTGISPSRTASHSVPQAMPRVSGSAMSGSAVIRKAVLAGSSRKWPYSTPLAFGSTKRGAGRSGSTDAAPPASSRGVRTSASS